ncbi:MAG: MarR family transcriptional regulator [Spirochaetales bacterium]|nr:MarR family transcriptional regulator [Spirochaetales bacterium]
MQNHNPDTDNLTHRLMDSFSGLHKRLHHEFYTNVCSSLKPSQLMIMLRLLRHSSRGEGGMRVSDIAAFMDVTSSAVTQIITSLEKSEFIEREIDPDDRRAVRVVLTAKGRDVLKPAKEKMENRFRGLVEELGEEDSRTLSGLLIRLEEYFG